MNIIVTNTDQIEVPMSSTDGIKPWITTLYPQTPAPIGQPSIISVTVGENAGFHARVGRKLMRLGAMFQRAVLRWRGTRSEVVVRLGIENIGPNEVDVVDSAGLTTRLGVGALLQTVSPNYVTINEVTP